MERKAKQKCKTIRETNGIKNLDTNNNYALVYKSIFLPFKVYIETIHGLFIATVNLAGKLALIGNYLTRIKKQL